MSDPVVNIAIVAVTIRIGVRTKARSGARFKRSAPNAALYQGAQSNILVRKSTKPKIETKKRTAPIMAILMLKTMKPLFRICVNTADFGQCLGSRSQGKRDGDDREKSKESQKCLPFIRLFSER
jgi:hypothetical protein